MEFISRLPVHHAAKAYVSGCGLIENVKPHLGKKNILKLDFSDFFHSFKPYDLFTALLNAEISDYSTFEVDVLSKFLFWKPERNSSRLILSIGAPSSPLLSNAIMFRFDMEVADYAEKLGVAYTRYADDITFSSNEIEDIDRIEKFLNEYVAKMISPRLKFNEEKRRLVKEFGQKRVTGLNIVDNERITVSRSVKRKIRAALFQVKYNKISNLKSLESAIGMLSYLKSIESDFFDEMVAKFGIKTLEEARHAVGKLRNNI
jgi:hypothetical protein